MTHTENAPEGGREEPRSLLRNTVAPQLAAVPPPRFQLQRSAVSETSLFFVLYFLSGSCEEMVLREINQTQIGSLVLGHHLCTFGL